MTSTILCSTDPREPTCRQALIDKLGREDAEKLIRFVLETHETQGLSFGDALALIVEQTERLGLPFAHNLLEMAWKPREVREAEIEILGWAKPKIEQAANVVLGHRADPSVAKKQFADLCVELMDKLTRMFPDKHVAAVRGAVLVAFTHKDGQFSLDVAALVKAIHTPIPLPGM
jgi:hypothetical protein